MTFHLLPVSRLDFLLLKARRSPRLIRKVRTVTRDGVAYQQAFWVLPDQAEAEDLPAGAQFDLFEQMPPEPEPEPVKPAGGYDWLDLSGVYLSKEIEDEPDARAQAYRKLAGDIAEYCNDQMARRPDKFGDDDVWFDAHDMIMKRFPPERTREEYGLPGKATYNLLASLRLYNGDRWEEGQTRFDLAAKGILAVETTSGDTIASKFQGLDRDDAIRMYAFFSSKDRGDPYFHLYHLIADNIASAWYTEDFREMRYEIDGLRRENRALIAAGKKSFPYRVGKTRMIFKNDHAVEAEVSADFKPTGDPVADVKALVARGVKTHQDCIAIGKIIYEATVGHASADAARAQAASEKLSALFVEYKRRRAELDGIGKKAHKEAMSTSGDIGSVMRKWREKADKLEAKVNALAKEMIALQEERDAAVKAVTQAGKTDPSKVIEFLSKIRPMGPGQIQFTKARYTGSVDPSVVRSAMAVFPTAWLEQLAEKPLEYVNVQQGRGSAGNGKVRAPWKPGMQGHAKMTQAHEIGHIVEVANGLTDLCKQFVYSLADESNDGQVKTNRGAMRSWQKGLESPHLPNQYCGVLYAWGNTEVVSMASGDLYEDFDNRLARGEKYWHFIFGLWAGV